MWDWDGPIDSVGLYVGDKAWNPDGNNINALF